MVTLLPDYDMCETGPDDKQAQQGRGRDKYKEETVVAASDAIVEPNTVVILCLDAIVANPTVMGAGRAPDVAAFAVFGGHLHCRIARRR